MLVAKTPHLTILGNNGLNAIHDLLCSLALGMILLCLSCSHESKIFIYFLGTKEDMLQRSYTSKINLEVM
jgi:hypothetical protein